MRKWFTIVEVEDEEEVGRSLSGPFESDEARDTAIREAHYKANMAGIILHIVPVDVEGDDDTVLEIGDWIP